MVAQAIQTQDDYLWMVGPEWDALDGAWARDELISFIRRLSPRYRPTWFHFLISEKLRAVLDGEISRLILILPPRHGKSTLCSRYFPAWYLGNKPENRIIATSYADRLAHRFGRFTRNVMQDPAYPFALQLARDSKSAEQWDIAEHAGGYMAAGVGGSITGEGADILLIDDTVKGSQEADSEAFRERSIEWYTETAYPRLEPGGAVVMIGTRWREDDLIGYVMDQQTKGGDQWEIVLLPAINEAGEPLWPERYGLDELHRRKANMTTRMWEAQFQGRPSAEEGGAFKRHWWRFWHFAGQPLAPVTVRAADGRYHVCRASALPPTFDDHLQSWDFTFKETTSGSYVVGQVWGATGAYRYLTDQYRARVDFPDSVLAVQAMSAKHPGAVRKLIESKANGSAVVATLRGKVAGLIEVEPQGGKEARANAVTPFVEGGNVFLPHPDIASWVDSFIQECAAFPYGKNDDVVDAMSQALLRFGASEASTASSYSYIGDDAKDDDDEHDPHAMRLGARYG